MTKHCNSFANPLDWQKNDLNRHHLLWPHYAWRGKYLNKLRGYPYLIVHIPQDTLHDLIHRELPHGIPRLPDGSAEAALSYLVKADQAGLLDYDQETPSQRLARLINFWQDDPHAQATIRLLKAEKEILDAYFGSTSASDIRHLCSASILLS